MGFGVFGGGGSSKKYTTVNTTTTTNMRDVGLTGQQAVDLAAIIEMGSIERHSIDAGVIEMMFSGASEFSQSLIGGASDIMQGANLIYYQAAEERASAGEAVAEQRIAAGEDISAQRTRMADVMVQERMSMLRSATGENIPIDKLMPLVLVGGVILIGIIKFK